nr:uncharacterized protein LOC119165612 [Rhipicephalus microplus]
MLTCEIFWKLSIITALILVICATGCDFAEIDWGYDSNDDYVPGRSCRTSADCEPFKYYCCVIQRPNQRVGYCNYRGIKGEKCSNKLYRTVENNNYYAPYLHYCPCEQPKYVCHRSHGLEDVGKCEFYTKTKPGG